MPSTRQRTRSKKVSRKRKGGSRSLSKNELEALVEEAIIDAYDESEQTVGFFTMLEEHLALSFQTQVLGVTIGHQNPYTLMVGGDLGDPQWDGIAWQCLPLYDLAHHARRWSDEALAIALIADPRVKPSSRKQRDTLLDLCAELCLMFGVDPLGTDGDCVPWLAGHDELPHGSRDPTKRCPGDLLSMDEVRRDVATLIREGALQRMLGIGLVL